MSLYFVSGFISAPIIRRHRSLANFLSAMNKIQKYFLKFYEYIIQAVNLAMF